MIRARTARLVADFLRGTAHVLLWLSDLASPVLHAARWCDDRAREWDPRLWDRGGDRRSDAWRRRP